mgnify:FL=1
MEIKKIKMSPKRGGNGFVSSYSVNIGSTEAKECGLVDDTVQKVIVKVVDPDNHQITIKEKHYTLTDEILHTVMDYSTKSNELTLKMELGLPSTQVYDGYRVIDLSEIPIPGLDTDNPYANELRVLDKEFYEYLLSLPYEALTDLITLMYMGRDADADMTLPSAQRFADYWAYMENIGCFSEGREAIASQVMDKTPLVQYLQNGRKILFANVQRSGISADGGIEDEDGNSDWL